MMKREAEKSDEIRHFFLLVLFCKVKTFRAIRSTDLTRLNSTFQKEIMRLIMISLLSAYICKITIRHQLDFNSKVTRRKLEQT